MALTCSVERCQNQCQARGLCQKHYHCARRNGELSGFANCSVLGCSRPYYVRKFCVLHYHRKRRTGKLTGSQAPNGSGTIGRGYRRFHMHGRYIFEHRLVMEKFLGRQLSKTEVVHHANGNRLDNRPENLQIMSLSEHAKLHRLGTKIGR